MCDIEVVDGLLFLFVSGHVLRSHVLVFLRSGNLVRLTVQHVWGPGI